MKRKNLRVIVAIVCVAVVLLTALPSAFAASPTMRLGSSGDHVTTLQSRLHGLGYLDYKGPTGYYGPVTQTAVVRFQQNNGLAADGIAGPLTQNKLYGSSARPLILKTGSYGEAVRALQLRLKALGFFNGTGTGYYGPVTRAAVVAFQQAAQLSADGIAGPITRIAAFSGNSYSTTQTSSTSAIADIALEQIDKPYVLGGNGPSSYDCSGLAYYAMTNAGFSVPRYSAAAYSGVSSWAKITGTSSLQKGDLVFFRSDGSASISHMGIYTGNSEFVHASSGQGRVMVSTLNNSYWARNYLFARRVA